MDQITSVTFYPSRNASYIIGEIINKSFMQKVDSRFGLLLSALIFIETLLTISIFIRTVLGLIGKKQKNRLLASPFNIGKRKQENRPLAS